MNFDELHQVIPKLLSLWTSEDVTKWLQWLKVRVKLSKFAQSGVDGSILTLITMDDLENEFEVSSIGTRKKLMQWFNSTLSQYNTYVQSKLEDKMMMVEPLIEKNWSTSTSSSVQIENEILDDKIELLIRPFDDDNQSNDHFYKLTNDNMSIGRNNNCHMCVRQSTVSGSHAKIWKQGNKFFLQDVGSKNGTYIKTRQRQYLQAGYMLEMGQYLFEVTRIDSKSMQMVCTRIEFENIPLKIEITQNQSYKIGRNSDNDLFFADDLHLSGRHAKIYLLNGRFVIQDLESTNGTWRRISKSGTISQPQRLHNKTVIKIGNSNSYVCNFSSNPPLRQVHNDFCLVCKQQKPRDGLLLPCRHLVGCTECVQIISQCPICSISVTSFFKIY